MSRPDKKQRQRARQQRKAERRASQQSLNEVRTIPCSKESTSEPVRGALAPVIDDTLLWHMAKTKPLLGPLGRKHLDDALAKHEVRSYRPRASEVVVRRGRRVVRHVPLLVRTIIVGVRDEDHLRTVSGLPGVSEMVSHLEAEGNVEGNVAGIVMRPTRLDPKVLQRFMIALAANEVVRPVGIAAGDAVRVLNGPFATFPGLVEEILPNDRIRVAVAIFGRASPVVMGIADVTKA